MTATATTVEQELAEDIVNVLGKVESGEWTSGMALAYAVDQDRKSGTFTRAINSLLRETRIESHRRRGYRIARGG